ncbi:unnamed protein product [Rhizophagus irregularis]|nr:unnamed protein product [Rhizophagus irregularis]
MISVVLREIMDLLIKPSQHSFVQVDAYTKTPIPDLYNYKPSHTSWNVLTTKDILYYDIDIYLKFYKRSLPKDEPPPPQDDFSSPDIVTHDKDINPSPDILSTTPYDDNIPKSDLLEASSSINTVTPSKKDITSSIPPPTHNDSKINNTPFSSTYRTPSPIIMSNHRHACGGHFNNIYRAITIASSKDNVMDASASPSNTKVTHANLLHAQWSSKYTKKVVSYRTGRSYNVSYSARNLDILQVSGHRHIYSKRLTNFQESLSSNSKTAKLQNERYERSQRRVFKKYMPSTGRDLTFTDKLRIHRHKKFVSSNIRDDSSTICRKEAARSKKQEIFDHGSTEKHHDLRQTMKRRLTELTNFYHEGLSIYHNDLIHHANEPPKWYEGYLDELYTTTNENYGEFMRRYGNKRNHYRQDVQKHLNTKKGRITDDTRRVEHRPNKRDCPFYNSIGNASDPSPLKKLRYGDERPYTLLIKGRVLTA